MNDNDMVLKIDEFKKELKILIKKYKIGVHEADHYDYEDGYCGSDYYLTIEGETYYGESIDEIIESCQ